MTQKPKLEPGQRIKFVGPMLAPSGPDHGWKVGEEFRTGKVDEEWPNGTVFLVCGGKIHRRQVTHVLRPKQKPEKERERAEFWSEVDGKGRGLATFSGPNAKELCLAQCGGPPNRVVHIVELRENEVVLGRGELARAWDKIAPSLGAWNRGSFFETMAESLGLGKK